MKFISLFFCLSLSFRALSLSWPAGLFQAQSLQIQFLNPFKNYFVQVLESHAIQPRFQGLSIYEGDKIELDIDWVWRDGELSVFYRTSRDLFIMTVEAQQIENPQELAVLNFDSIINQPDFRINFNQIMYSLQKTTQRGEISLVFSPDWGNIFYREIKTEQELEGRMWYNCATCSGEPLLFKQKREGIPSYFVGQLVESVSPQRFLNIANRFYLSGIRRQSSTILSQLQNRFGFPKTSD